MPKKGNVSKKQTSQFERRPARVKPLPTEGEIRAIQGALESEFDKNPVYSLEVDPLGLYNFSPIAVQFIELMVQYKNVNFVAVAMMKLDQETGMALYSSPPVQDEIRRINLALYARRFATKMADLDQIGGFLTSAITDDNVPFADRLSGKDKLAAAKLLMDIWRMKGQAIEDPDVIDYVDIEKEIKSLRVEEIQMLIEGGPEIEDRAAEREELIKKIDSEGMLTPEEVIYLRSMSTDELKKLLEETRGSKK